MDCIPYDAVRVQILSTDVPNYINASHVMEIMQWIPTSFIITQTPLSDKTEVFWVMIWEQESEIIACLATDAQVIKYSIIRKMFKTRLLVVTVSYYIFS